MGTVSNVIVGTAQIYTASKGTSAPTVNATTALIVPGTPWTAIGFTDSGVTLNVDRKTNMIHVEEQSTPAVVVPDTTDVTIDFTLDEDTILNMKMAYGGGTITTVAASGSVAGYTKLTLVDTLTTLAVCFVGTNAAGFSRLFYCPDMTSGGKVKTSYRRAKANRQYPTTFTAICPLPTIVAIDATATKT